MRKLIVLALFLSACESSLNSPEVTANLNNSEAIIGGTEVPNSSSIARKALSLQVLYNRKEVQKGDAVEITWSSSQCTASAITPRLILTAAHCYSPSAEIHRLKIPRPDGTIQYIKVAKTEVHPDFTKENRVADLALMLLEEALPEHVEILSLPDKDMPLNLTEITAAGFGRMAGRQDLPGGVGTLRTVDVKVINYDETSPIFSVDQSAGKGVCQGDSGGPAMLSIHGYTFVVGVVSKTRYKPAEDGNHDYCNLRGEYVNVQRHLDWILPTAAALSKE